jgi:hypothetical protein
MSALKWMNARQYVVQARLTAHGPLIGRRVVQRAVMELTLRADTLSTVGLHAVETQSVGYTAESCNKIADTSEHGLPAGIQK